MKFYQLLNENFIILIWKKNHPIPFNWSIIERIAFKKITRDIFNGLSVFQNFKASLADKNTKYNNNKMK